MRTLGREACLRALTHADHCTQYCQTALPWVPMWLASELPVKHCQLGARRGSDVSWPLKDKSVLGLYVCALALSRVLQLSGV